ncbi:MAG: hypothetical protein V2I54_00855 [Bacteroidales bacterium]|jgi:3-isopropylmalate dehydratase small subunit|nr:hypothetical protein [Bacteroidales bacterium]
MNLDFFDRSKIIEGRAWIIRKDFINNQMIFADKFLRIDDFNELGQYTFSGLKEYHDFATKVIPGDILITGKAFGCGVFRQQSIDCFISLGIQAVIAASFCKTWEDHSIAAGFPVLTYKELAPLYLEQGDRIRVYFVKGMMKNLRNNRTTAIRPFSRKQMNSYLK